MVNKDKILELKNEGKSLQKIADELNISKSTVAYHLRGMEMKKLNDDTSVKPVIQNLPFEDYSPDSLLDEVPIRYEVRDLLTTSTWRNALYYVEQYYNYYFMHQCVREVMLDAHITAVMNLRKSRIQALPFFVEVNGVIDEQMHDFFDKGWFHKFLDLAHNAIFEGFSVIEITDFDENGIKDLHQIPMKFISPQMHTFQKVPQAMIYNSINYERRELISTDSSINYLEDPNFSPFVVECFYNTPLGILAKLVPLYIWKLTALQQYANHCETYSYPIRIGQTSTEDKKSKEKLFSIVRQMGRSLSAVIGANEKIELLSQNQNDPGNLYKGLISIANHEISKIILGGTTITDADASSRAQSANHQAVYDDIVDADSTWLRFIINDKLVPVIKNLSLIQKDAKINFFFNTIEDITLSQKWTIDNGLLEKGYILDTEYLMNTYDNVIIDLPSDPKLVQKNADILKHSPIGMQNLNTLLLNVGKGIIDREAAKAALINAWLFDEAVAESMIPTFGIGKPQPTENKSNEDDTTENEESGKAEGE